MAHEKAERRATFAEQRVAIAVLCLLSAKDCALKHPLQLIRRRSICHAGHDRHHLRGLKQSRPASV